MDAVTGAQLWGEGYDPQNFRRDCSQTGNRTRGYGEVEVETYPAKSNAGLPKATARMPRRISSICAAAIFGTSALRTESNRRSSTSSRAIERDPNFALGYVGLADSYTGLTFYNFAAPHETMPKAKESAIKALALDNTLAEAHASLAHVLIEL